MSLFNIENLIRFGLYNKTLKEANGKLKTPEDFDYNEASDSGELYKFTILVNGKPAEEYEVDFSGSGDNLNKFCRKLRERLPIVEMIDLIDYALNCGDRIIIDKTSEMIKDNLGNTAKPFKTYKGDYISLTKAGVFVFIFAEENSPYKVIFKNDGSRVFEGIEYASRSSRFINHLVTRIMTRYNILQVNKATMRSGSEHTMENDPAVADGFIINKSVMGDSETNSGAILSQIKVLINYSDYDTISNSAFTESIIDDVYLTFPEDGGDPEISDVINIVPNESDDDVNYERVELGNEAVKIIAAIKRYVEDDNAKIEIFDKLRKTDTSNLYRLYNQRKEQVYLQYRGKNERPKIEFSMTPLTVYSNHITQKTKRVIISSARGDEYFQDVTGEWVFNYDPMTNDELYYADVYSEDGIDHRIKVDDSNPLVLAVVEDFSPDGRPKADSKKHNSVSPKKARVVVASKARTIALCDINDYYKTYQDGNGIYIYNGVYVLRSDVITIESGQFFAKECYQCPIDGEWYHKSEMQRVKRSHVYVNGKILSNDDERVWVSETGRNGKKHIYWCGCCKTIWAGSEADIENKIRGKVLDNEEGIHTCCPECKNRVVEGTNKAIFRDSASGYYFLDDKDNPKFAMCCPACEVQCVKSDLVYVGPSELSKKTGRNVNKSTRICSVCGQSYCRKHMRKDENICILCKPNNIDNLDNFEDTIGRRIIKQIKHNFFPRASVKQCVYSINNDGLRVFCLNDDKEINKVYYFLIDKSNPDKPLYYLKNSQKVSK